MIGLIAKLLTGTAVAIAVVATAEADDKNVKIGVLTDLSGIYADLAGPGSVLAAQMAVEDSGMKDKGWKIDVISGDHQARDFSAPVH
jgi:branched-chain amino acid transport system substrate-binding protein